MYKAKGEETRTGERRGGIAGGQIEAASERLLRDFVACAIATPPKARGYRSSASKEKARARALLLLLCSRSHLLFLRYATLFLLFISTLFLLFLLI